MQYRSLGRSGLKVSAVGLGTNQFGGKVDEQGVDTLLGRAIDLGVNLIDTADVYQGGRSEEAIGKALSGRRERVLFATKVGMKADEGPNGSGASRQRIHQGIEASLRRLRTDCVDLYQIHRFDPGTPAEETMRALDDLITAGKVRYVGASNYAAWQLAHANAIAGQRGWSPFVSVQPHYHLLERGVESELIPYCKAFGVGILPYYPLAGGFLTGKYKRDQPAPKGSRGESSDSVRRYMTPGNYDVLERLEAWATDRDHTLLQLAVAWLLAQPQMSCVISGATRVEQLEANAKGADWSLSAAEEAEVRRLLTPP